MPQERLFEVIPEGPPGFAYEPEFISREEEKKLLEALSKASLKTFKWEGYDSKRRVKSYSKGSFPTLLVPIMKRAAKFAGVKPEEIEHALVNEYTPGTQIGWHRDKGAYNRVIGLSLGSAVPFRLRRKWGKGWERITITAEPRSIYLMSGDSMYLWQHSIAKVEKLRYSITMRTVRK